MRFNVFQLHSTSLSAYAWIWDAYENLWSHQRRRRRRHQPIDDQPPAKRLKSDEDSKTKICSIQVRLDEDQGVCSLYLLYVEGNDADAANQIGQYIKNEFPLFCDKKRSK